MSKRLENMDNEELRDYVEKLTKALMDTLRTSIGALKLVDFLLDKNEEYKEIIEIIELVSKYA